MKKCKKCGYPADSVDQLYCPICGTEFEDEPDVVSTDDHSTSVTKEPATAWEKWNDCNNKLLGGVRNRKLLLTIAAIVLLLIIGVVISNLDPLSKKTSSSGVSTVSSSASASSHSTQSTTSSAQSTSSEQSIEAPVIVKPESAENILPAEASETEVVFRNALPDAVVTMDGEPISFTYVGNDIVVQRSDLKDVCIVRIIAPVSDGGYQTAAVWYNFQYGNDMTFGDPDDYGDYVSCNEDGLGVPSTKVVDVLTWAYYTSLLKSINEQDTSNLRYSTISNTLDQATYIRNDSNKKNSYNMDNYVAVCDPESILYYEDSGTVMYNATFVSYATNRSTGVEKTISNHRTICLTWEGSMWKVSASAFLSEDDFNQRYYADTSH